MKIEIRRAELSDLDAIWRLNRDELGYDYPLEETREKLSLLLGRESDRIFVAVLDGVVAGYVHVCDYDVIYAPHMKNIMGIAVASAHRRSGIGRALLAAAEAWGKETGAAGIRLVSGMTRTGAHAFYRACGYTGDKQQLNLKKMWK